MKALITGGAGFIGSHLAEELLERGYEVIIIDDLSTGSIKNIEHLKTNVRFNYVIDNLLNRPRTTELIDVADVVFHLAAAVGVEKIIEDPVWTIETNIKATELVLELSSRKKKPVLFTSTSEVYGKLEKEKFSEDDDLVLGPTTNSRWSYAASKIIDEFLIKAYCKKNDLPAIIVRLFNTIGPRQTGRYGMVVPRFVSQALNNEDITVYGDGMQKRSFTYVKDVVRAMVDLVNTSDAYGDIFNIGHSEEITIYELARIIKELTGSKSDIVTIPYDQAYEPGFEDMRRRLPDLRRIESLIGYRHIYSLEEMLEIIIDYQRQNL